jgi:RiboL-PSP-HEPN
MPEIDRYFDEIDAARIRRARELSKAAVVLTYANWEGFYNDGVGTYVQFLTERGGKVRETDWMLLVGALNPAFESLRAKNHSIDAKHQFVAHMKERLECGFDSFDSTTVEARSNLNYERLSQNYFVLNFELSSWQRFRLRLNKEVVGWRHSVAHGDSPDLSALDIADHVDFAAHLLIVVADRFQYAMLDRM